MFKYDSGISKVHNSNKILLEKMQRLAQEQLLGQHGKQTILKMYITFSVNTVHVHV